MKGWSIINMMHHRYPDKKQHFYGFYFLLISVGISLILFTPNLGYSGGFFMGDQGANVMGTGGAYVSRPDDLHTIFHNPAGLGHIHGTNFVVSGSMLYFVEASYTRAADDFMKWYAEDGYIEPLASSGNLANEEYNTDEYQYKRTPVDSRLAFSGGYFGLSTDLWDEDWVLGFCANSVYGSGVKYPKTGPNRYMMKNVMLFTVDFSPTLAYNITEYLSVGAGVSLTYGFMSAQMDVDPYALLFKANPPEDPILDMASSLLKPNQENPEYAIDNQMDMSGFTGTGNLGILFKIGSLLWNEDSFALGFNYHLPTILPLSGKANLTLSDKLYTMLSSVSNLIGEISKQEKVSTDLTLQLPMYFRVGMTYGLEDRLFVSAEFVWWNWSVFKEYHIRLPKNPAANPFYESFGMDHITYKKNWRNSYAIRAGIKFIITHWIYVMGGYFYDTTPINEKYLQMDYPGNDKHGITLGASVNLMQNAHLDFTCIQYIFKDRNIPVGSSQQNPPVEGLIELNALVFSLTVRYQYN